MRRELKRDNVKSLARKREGKGTTGDIPTLSEYSLGVLYEP